MEGFAALVLAAAAWIGLHLGVAGTRARDAVVARTGEAGFRGLFSLASVAALWALVAAWRAAPAVPLWTLPGWARWPLALLMLVALLLFVAAVAAPNPTAVGGGGPGRGPRGLLRVTRHPMLWSFALWAAVHALASGDAAGLLFFGAIGATALAGMPSIDAKLARRDPAAWAPFAAATSVLPFAALAAGRARWVPGELRWRVPALALAAWALLLWAHPRLFGVAALPG